MKFRNLSIAALMVLFVVTQAQAQTLIDPHRTTGEGRFDLSGVVSFSEIEYEGEIGGDGAIERKILGVTGAYGLSRIIDLYGELGYIIEAEPDEINDDDDGFILGVGFRGAVHSQDQLSVILRGGVRYIDESYSILDTDIIDLEIGAAARYDINNKFSAYGGLDIYPISEGETGSSGVDIDLERDDIFGVRIGGDYRLNRVLLNAEIGLIGEEALIFRVKIPM